jgi:hypothetical protein
MGVGRSRAAGEVVIAETFTVRGLDGVDRSYDMNAKRVRTEVDPDALIILHAEPLQVEQALAARRTGSTPALTRA